MDNKVLQRLLDTNQLEPYIRYIRFPQYKNVTPFTKLELSFPITALVGENGTNKSSLLRALYGSPGNNNLGNYWFSTETDPIEEGDKFPNCFIYGYQNSYARHNIEVLKTRVRKENDPDYWETSRPIRQYGMDAMPPFDSKDPHRTRTRWRAISKPVEFIDFRHALSAFDRYFYYGDFSHEATFGDKKEFIRSRAPHLNRAINESSASYIYYVERIVNGKNGALTDEELSAVSGILGRGYEEIRLIFHRFFRIDGYTARIRQASLRYTEAFAGSGEFATIILVTQIMRASPRSLILLDEPEVSLHPGAQERLLEFFARQVIVNKHQIVFTTHSPALIRRLPPHAIKVLAVEGRTGQVILAAQSSLPEEAFLQIGEPIAGIRTLLVEDRLAAEIARKALRMHAPQQLQLLDIRYFPGGVSALFQHYLSPYAAERRKDVLCFLDGDQAPAEPWPTDEAIRVANDDELAAMIKAQSGSDIQFPLDSGTDAEKKAQLTATRRNFLKWCRMFVRYLPGGVTPEQFILNKTGMSNEEEPKKRFANLTRQQYGLLDSESASADDIFGTQRRYLNMIDDHDNDLELVATTISNFLAMPNQR